MPAENLVMYGYDLKTGKNIIYYTETLDSTAVAEKYNVYATFKAGKDMFLTDEDKMPIDGFKWKSWRKKGEGNLWLKYSRNSYVLHFANCTGVADASIKFEANVSGYKPLDKDVQPPANVDSDYIFAGWYTSPACEDGT